MVRRKIDGSKAGYRSSMGREHLGGNKLKRRGEREKGEEEGREGRREERKTEVGACVYMGTHSPLGPTHREVGYSSWSHPQRGWVRG